MYMRWLIFAKKGKNLYFFFQIKGMTQASNFLLIFTPPLFKKIISFLLTDMYHEDYCFVIVVQAIIKDNQQWQHCYLKKNVLKFMISMPVIPSHPHSPPNTILSTKPKKIPVS